MRITPRRGKRLAQSRSSVSGEDGLEAPQPLAPAGGWRGEGERSWETHQHLGPTVWAAAAATAAGETWPWHLPSLDTLPEVGPYSCGRGRGARAVWGRGDLSVCLCPGGPFRCFDPTFSQQRLSCLPPSPSFTPSPSDACSCCLCLPLSLPWAWTPGFLQPGGSEPPHLAPSL